MRRLSLQRNQLKQIERTTFNSLPGISWLNLSENRLTTLYHATISHIEENFLREDSSFSVNGNEFICDCKLEWMVAFRNRTKSAATKQALNRISCLLTGHDIPDELVQNGLDVVNGSDYVAEDGDPTYVRSVDLEHGAVVNLFLLDRLPCVEDESDPTSFPLSRESTGPRGGGQMVSVLSNLPVILPVALVISHLNNRDLL